MSIYPDSLGIHLSKNSLTFDQIENIKSSLPKNVIVRIFGFAGAGKGTLSQILSSYLSIPNVESSLIWRAATHIFEELTLPITPKNGKLVFSKIQTTTGEGNTLNIVYDGILLEKSVLKRSFIDEKVSIYSSVDFLREEFYDKLVSFLKSISSSCILDGRGAYPRYIKDMEANGYNIIRIFLDARDDVKAERYYLAKIGKLKLKNSNFVESESEKIKIINEFKLAIVERNKNDWETWLRLNMGTLTEDTGVLDTSDLNEQETAQTALAFIKSRI